MSIRFRPLAVSALSCSLLLSGVCLAQTTERVSVSSLGAQANDYSRLASISGNGRYVVITSSADNLVPADTNGSDDIFVHDRLSGVTERVSVSSLGAQANDSSGYWYWSPPSISSNGRYVTFGSLATNLVPGDTNGVYDTFVHDRETGVTKRVSLSSQGAQGYYQSSNASIAANGRYVAFTSFANNLVPGDTNWYYDIFVHDRQSGATERVSVDSSGMQANGSSSNLSISADGRFVAFDSLATNLVPADTNGWRDIFVHDRQTDVTERVSVDSLGVQGDGHCNSPSISADGRYVAFQSPATNLAPGDTNGNYDIFVHDRQTGVTEFVSVNSLGAQANGGSEEPSISADGRYVTFHSAAWNLVPEDTNGNYDIFVHDRQTGITERVSDDSLGAQANGRSEESSISADGRHVAFHSDAWNLVPGDTNGDYDIFVHDRWDGLGANSIYLKGPRTAPVLAPVHFSWQTTRANSKYSLAVSTNRNGAVIDGHTFDIGYRMTVITTGTNATNGTGSFTSAPVPAGASGLTLYFEVAARDGAGILFDSNVLAVTFY